MSWQLLPNVDITHVERALLGADGKLVLFSSDAYDNIEPDELRLFCSRHGRYGLPTVELITFLNELIDGRAAIEIGAGCGDLGHYLKIPMTDSKIQANPEVAAFYEMTGQPVIKYPDDVEALDAAEAVNKYKPKVVVGSWITQWIDPNLPPPPGGGSILGVKEEELLDIVDAYILVGNIAIHGHKKIMSRRPKVYSGAFLRSRASQPELDRVFVWER